MRPFLFGAAVISLVSCTDKKEIPFCSFEQLSDKPAIQIGKEIREKPQLVHVSYPLWDKSESGATVSSWLLNRQYSIIHKKPAMGLRLKYNAEDSLFIGHSKFDLAKIMFCNQLEPVIESIRYFKKESEEYLFLKIINAANGTHYGCNLLVFAVSDTNHIICVNELSHVCGETWLANENLITDLDGDGKPELNLLDNAAITAFVLDAGRITKSNKTIAFRQRSDNYFVIDPARSNWYFDLTKTNRNQDSCPFDFEFPADSVYEYR